jgi:hypothetical protein
MPVECDIYLASDPSYARPPTPWLPCGEGCLELVPDWDAPEYGMHGSVYGASNGSARFIGYKRNLATEQEIQIVQLPENVVTLDVVIPRTADCFAALMTLSVDYAFLKTFMTNTDLNLGPDWYTLVQAGESVPFVAYALEHGTTGPLEVVTTADLWAASWGRRDLYWHSTEPGAPELGWESSDGRYLHSMAAHGTDVFFSLEHIGAGPYEIMGWDPVEGARKLLEYPVTEEGGACCLYTDGVDMVWLHGYGAFDAETFTYSDMELMASPYATDASQFVPRRLRRSNVNKLIGTRGMVGGGYALHEEYRSATEEHMVLTRLADGAYWVLEPRPEHVFGQPLYVDAEEFAVVETLVPAVVHDAGLNVLDTYGIARYQIDSLGPPLPPD